MIDNWCKLASTYYIYVYVFTVELLSREVDLVSRKRSGDSRWLQLILVVTNQNLVIAIYHIPRFGVSFHTSVWKMSSKKFGIKKSIEIAVRNYPGDRDTEVHGRP